jgi:predicted extracellular nuclease
VVNFSKGSGGSGDENYRILPTLSSFQYSKHSHKHTSFCRWNSKNNGLNVLNYFKTLDAWEIKLRTAAVHVRITKQKFNRQREKLITALKLMDADVLG